MHNTQERIFNMFVNYFIFQILEDYNQKIKGMQKQPDWSEIFWLGLCVKLFSMKYFRYKLLNSFFASGNIIYLLLQSLRQIFEHEWKYFNLNMKRLKSLIQQTEILQIFYPRHWFGYKMLNRRSFSGDSQAEILAKSCSSIWQQIITITILIHKPCSIEL